MLEAGLPATEKLDGAPMLIFAVMQNASLPTIQAIIDGGADLESKTMDGRNVCHWACRKARLDLIQNLHQMLQLQGKQNMWEQRTGGKHTPAMLALHSKEATEELIRFCIEHLGLRADDKDRNGMTSVE